MLAYEAVSASPEAQALSQAEIADLRKPRRRQEEQSADQRRDRLSLGVLPG